MNMLRIRLQKFIYFFVQRKPKVPLNPVVTPAPTPNLNAGDHAIQIGHVAGDVYLSKKMPEPNKVEVAEAVRLHLSLPTHERRSVVKWMQKEFDTGMIKDLDRAKLGLALRYIRVVHKRVNSKAM